MTQKIYGDLQVLRTLNADRRVNQGMSRETITGDRSVLINDFAWLQITNSTTQDVILPDATTLENGWSIVVMADVNSVASVNVMTYDAVTPVLSKNILIDRAYRFTLLDNGSATGVWHLDFLEEADKVPAERYVDNFTAAEEAAGWAAAAGGYHTRTITQATHLRGSNPSVQCFVVNGSDFDEVMPDLLKIAANGDVIIRVTEAPDLKFAGRLIII